LTRQPVRETEAVVFEHGFDARAQSGDDHRPPSPTRRRCNRLCNPLLRHSQKGEEDGLAKRTHSSFVRDCFAAFRSQPSSCRAANEDIVQGHLRCATLTWTTRKYKGRAAVMGTDARDGCELMLGSYIRKSDSFGTVSDGPSVLLTSHGPSCAFAAAAQSRRRGRRNYTKET
jgi:hypothetical protein